MRTRGVTFLRVSLTLQDNPLHGGETTHQFSLATGSACLACSRFNKVERMSNVSSYLVSPKRGSSTRARGLWHLSEFVGWRNAKSCGSETKIGKQRCGTIDRLRLL